MREFEKEGMYKVLRFRKIKVGVLLINPENSADEPRELTDSNHNNQ